MWISGDWELFRPNKSMIFKGLAFRRILIIIKKDIADRRFKAHWLGALVLFFSHEKRRF